MKKKKRQKISWDYPFNTDRYWYRIVGLFLLISSGEEFIRNGTLLDILHNLGKVCHIREFRYKKKSSFYTYKC
jgi:hypothetical protein